MSSDLGKLGHMVILAITNSQAGLTSWTSWYWCSEMFDFQSSSYKVASLDLLSYTLTFKITQVFLTHSYSLYSHTIYTHTHIHTQLTLTQLKLTHSYSHIQLLLIHSHSHLDNLCAHLCSHTYKCVLTHSHLHKLHTCTNILIFTLTQYTCTYSQLHIHIYPHNYTPIDSYSRSNLFTLTLMLTLT